MSAFLHLRRSGGRSGDAVRRADCEAAGGGALAFKLVCKTCRGLLAPFLNDLQDLYTQAVNHAAGGAAGGVEQGRV